MMRLTPPCSKAACLAVSMVHSEQQQALRFATETFGSGHLVNRHSSPTWRRAPGVVAGGGFTLMGEAVFLHKPMLSVPLAGQFEQYLNASYLAREGFGMFAESVDDPAVIRQFVAEIPKLAGRVATYQQTDNREILNAIDEFLRVLPR